MPEFNNKGKEARIGQKFDTRLRNEVDSRKEFSDREVGLTHPDNRGFLRIADNGDIEIFSGAGIGMIISSESGTISLFADSIRLHTKDDELRWNGYTFNPSADDFSEPTFIKTNMQKVHSAVRNVDYYLDYVNRLEEEEEQKTVTIKPEFGYYDNSSGDNLVTKQTLESDPDYSDLSLEQLALLEVYLNDYGKDHVDLMVQYVSDGLTIIEAHRKVLRTDA